MGSESQAASDGGVFDIHSHAMPLPLLERLAGAGPRRRQPPCRQGIVRLDPRVSGVGPGAPLPLAKSQYDVGVRLTEMDEVGARRSTRCRCHRSCSAPRPTTKPSPPDRPEGNDELAQYVAQAPDRCSGWVMCRWAGQVCRRGQAGLDDSDMAGIAIGSQGGGKDLDDPVNDDLWALLAERGTFAFMHPSGMPAGARLKDFWMPQFVGYPMETAIAVARLTFGRVLERFPFQPVPRARWWVSAVAAWPDGHGMGPQGCRPHDGGAAQRVHRSAVLRHRGVQLDDAGPDRRGCRCRSRDARHRSSLRTRRFHPRRDRPAPWNWARPTHDGDPGRKRTAPDGPARSGLSVPGEGAESGLILSPSSTQTEQPCRQGVRLLLLWS